MCKFCSFFKRNKTKNSSIEKTNFSHTSKIYDPTKKDYKIDELASPNWKKVQPFFKNLKDVNLNVISYLVKLIDLKLIQNDMKSIFVAFPNLRQQLEFGFSELMIQELSKFFLNFPKFSPELSEINKLSLGTLILGIFELSDSYTKSRLLFHINKLIINNDLQNKWDNFKKIYTNFLIIFNIDKVIMKNIVSSNFTLDNLISISISTTNTQYEYLKSFYMYQQIMKLLTNHLFTFDKNFNTFMKSINFSFLEFDTKNNIYKIKEELSNLFKSLRLSDLTLNSNEINLLKKTTKVNFWTPPFILYEKIFIYLLSILDEKPISKLKNISNSDSNYLDLIPKVIIDEKNKIKITRTEYKKIETILNKYFSSASTNIEVNKSNTDSIKN